MTETSQGERERDDSYVQTKPTRSNLISPKEAITTPRTMIPTFPSTFMFGGAMPKAQVANRVTTALVALSIWMKETDRYR